MEGEILTAIINRLRPLPMLHHRIGHRHAHQRRPPMRGGLVPFGPVWVEVVVIEAFYGHLPGVIAGVDVSGMDTCIILLDQDGGGAIGVEALGFQVIVVEVGVWSSVDALDPEPRCSHQQTQEGGGGGLGLGPVGGGAVFGGRRRRWFERELTHGVVRYG